MSVDKTLLFGDFQNRIDKCPSQWSWKSNLCLNSKQYANLNKIFDAFLKKHNGLESVYKTSRLSFWTFEDLFVRPDKTLHGFSACFNYEAIGKAYTECLNCNTISPSQQTQGTEPFLQCHWKAFAQQIPGYQVVGEREQIEFDLNSESNPEIPQDTSDILLVSATSIALKTTIGVAGALYFVRKAYKEMRQLYAERWSKTKEEPRLEEKKAKGANLSEHPAQTKKPEQKPSGWRALGYTVVSVACGIFAGRAWCSPGNPLNPSHRLF